TGNVTVSSISIDDALTGSNDLAISPADLAPGETGTASATYTITQADMDAGFVSNSATATGDSPGNTDDVSDVSDNGDDTDGNTTDDATVVNFTPQPAIELVKTAVYSDTNTNSVQDAGDQITYTFTVTNTGNVTVSSISIDDALTGSNDLAITPANLAPGAIGTASANYTITQADMDAGFVSNSATATGDSPGNTADVSDVSDNGDDTDGNTTDDATVVNFTPQPAIEAVKTVRVTGSKVGDVIEYDIVVTNTGNVTVNNIEITDADADVGSISGSPILTLAPGEAATVTANQTITQAHMDAGFVSNSATATGDSPSGTDDVTDVSDNGDDTDGNTTDDSTETPLDQNTAMEISKAASVSNFANVGDVIEYTITLTNTGNTTINSITITDDNAENLTLQSGDLNSDNLLDVGEEWIYTASHTVTSTDFNNGFVENIAQVDAKGPLGSDLQEVSNTVRTGAFRLEDDNVSTDEDTNVIINVLDNDKYDPAADVIITNTTQPANGSVVINADNTVTYTPNPDFNGTDTFEYTATVTNADGSTTSETTTVTVTVEPVADAVADMATTQEDETVVIDVLDNDTYAAGTDVAVTATTTPANGSVVINADNTVTYTPNADFNGTDTFEYTATVTNADGSTTSETTTVTVTVEPVADAVADMATTQEDEAVVIDVLDNDTYAAGTDVEVTSTTTPANGSVVINADNTVTYTPNADFNGTDTFEYTATVTNADGSTTSETTTVTVTVEPVADAVADMATTQEDETVVIDVLDNDTYAAGTDVAVTAASAPVNGSVVINSDNTVTYTPNADFNGTDTFEYTATLTNADGSMTSETTTVAVTVTPVADAVADTATTSEDEAVTIDVLDNDTYNAATDVEVTAASAPANGNVVINSDNTVTYTPNPDFNGTDTFEYTATVTNADGSTTSETTTVTVKVEPVADAVADTATTQEDEAVVIDVLDNDTYAAGTDVEVTSTTTPANGSVVINADNTVTYTPNADFNGTDTFEYTATVTNADGSTTSETTTVTVTVEPVADAVADMATTQEDETVVIDVLDNDTYAAGTDVEVTSTTTPANGSVVINADNTVTYTPNADFNGTDTFEYTATVTNADGTTTSETTTVTITVEPVADAVADTATTSEDVAVTIDVLDNDTYAAGTDVAVTAASAPANGSVVINADNTVTYTPNPDFNGTDTFEYTATVTNADGSTTSETTMVTVTVEPVADAVADTATTSEDEAVTIDVLDNDTYDAATDVEVTAASAPANGSVVINADNTVTYTPNPDFNGTDTFEYTATVTNADGTTTSETTTVTITVEPVADAVADTATTSEDEAVTIDVLDNDTYDAATDVEVTAASAPANGSVVINADNTVTYTPNADFNGTDTFEYTATVTNADGTMTSENTTVTVTVEPVADAVADTATTLENNPVTVDVLENDTYAETTNVVVSSVTQPENGAAILNDDDTVTYIPNTEFFGTDIFEYTSTVTNADGSTTSETTTVTITVDKQPDAPTVLVEQPDCENAFGTIEIETIEGYAYSLNGGEFSEVGLFENLESGVYVITAKDSKGYISPATTIEIFDQPVTPEAPQVEEILQADCIEPTGTLILIYNAGLEYFIENEEGETIFDEDDDAIFEGLAPGDYNVFTRSESGCVSQPTNLVIENPTANDIAVSDINWCIGDLTFDLFDAFSGEYDSTGTWQADDYAESLDGSIVDPTILGTGTFKFTYTIEGPCPSITEVIVNINDDCVVLPCTISDIKKSISKVVTPNGDNQNDFFTIDQDVECDFIYDVMIFNRWGAKVFEAKNYQNNWDGQSQKSFTSSNQLPSGTYYYFVKMRGSDMQPIQGYIYLGTK
ncbi:Ig-like domain-containing protein, partial [Christiangramia sabulilitoris]